MKPQFCPHCRTPLFLAPLHGRPREHCPACGYVAFHNPAPVGLALIECERRLVLIRRANPPLAGYWAPPAGYVEVGESVPAAVIREAREESGLDIVLDGLVGVYSRADVKVLIVAYRAHAVGGVPMAGDDAVDIGLFAAGDLPTQARPLAGTATDDWFYDVIHELTAPWQTAPRRSPLGRPGKPRCGAGKAGPRPGRQETRL